MTMKDLVVFAVLAFMVPPLISSFSSGDVKERIKRPPSAVPGFDVLRFIGPWYFQFHRPSYSWSGSEDFTDYSKVFELQGNKLINHENMRNHGLCNSVTSVWYIKGSGYFTGVDPVGNNWTGKIIVVDTDYKSFYISWGCTKWSVFGDRCDDPGLYILTRRPKLHPEVLRRIDIVLQHRFGISVKELTKIPHGKPCSSEVKSIG